MLCPSGLGFSDPGSHTVRLELAQVPMVLGDAHPLAAPSVQGQPTNLLSLQTGLVSTQAYASRCETSVADRGHRNLQCLAHTPVPLLRQEVPNDVVSYKPRKEWRTCVTQMCAQFIAPTGRCAMGRSGAGESQVSKLYHTLRAERRGREGLP